MRLIARLVVFALLMLAMSIAAFAQDKAKKPQPQPPITATERPVPDAAQNLPPEFRFYISPVEGTKGVFSVLLTNGKNTASGTFTLRQVEVFEAVLEDARAFALTNERVGVDAPIITRLMEQHEWSLFVDVSKMGNQSRFYLSLITPTGKLTAEAGEIIRGSKKEPSALLLSILSQVRAVRASANGQH
jgi:hypothetical protein